jgi:cytidylate kinase
MRAQTEPIPIVAIDGPAGAGKSTVARELAHRLGFTIIDTGAIYRAVALAARDAGVAWEDDAGLRRLLEQSFQLSFRPAPGEAGQRVLLAGADVTEAIRTPEITRGSSVVSARAVVRERLLGLQRRLGREAPRGAVLEGRDIGTVVFPKADLKVFLTASEEERARRRQRDDRAPDVGAVAADLARRDTLDSNRAASPLRSADDAVVIDTTARTVDDVVDEVVGLLP